MRGPRPVTRRRPASRGRSGLVALGVVLGVALTSLVVSTVAHGPASSAAGGPSTRVDGYPQRIGFDRPSPLLPDRPGALAATVRDNNFGDLRQLGVTPEGELYELPYGPDVLSPDGTLLLTGQGDWSDSRIAVQDLVTGDLRVFDHLGMTIHGTEPGQVDFKIDTNSAVHWSPDGRTVLARFGDGGHGLRLLPRLMDVSTGELTVVAAGSPAGFLATGEAVTVRWEGEPSHGTVLVTITDVATGEATSRPLVLDGPWHGDPDARLEASVSPDGTLALLEGSRDDVTLRLFAPDGAELGPRRVSDWDGCPPAWLDDDPVVPTATRGSGGSLAAGAELASADGSRPLVAVHHRMQSSCLQLAADALGAGPHLALFGTSTAVWTWYWWQLLLAAVLALVALVLVVRRGRRSARRGRPPCPATPTAP